MFFWNCLAPIRYSCVRQDLKFNYFFAYINFSLSQKWNTIMLWCNVMGQMLNVTAAPTSGKNTKIITQQSFHETFLALKWWWWWVSSHFLLWLLLTQIKWKTFHPWLIYFLMFSCENKRRKFIEKKIQKKWKREDIEEIKLSATLKSTSVKRNHCGKLCCQLPQFRPMAKN